MADPYIFLYMYYCCIVFENITILKSLCSIVLFHISANNTKYNEDAFYPYPVTNFFSCRPFLHLLHIFKCPLVYIVHESKQFEPDQTAPNRSISFCFIKNILSRWD